MTSEERQKILGDCRKWGQPRCAFCDVLPCGEVGDACNHVMSLGDIAQVLSEDVIDADHLTANQRGLILSCCAQVSKHE